MTHPTPAYLTALRQGIVGAFSIEELITLCSDLGVDYENLGGQGKEGKARELIAHLVRRDELAPLVQYCTRKRPRYPWPQAPALATQAPSASDAQILGGGVPPRTTDGTPPRSDAATRHLHQQLAELQGRYETLSKRIAALDTDIGRELDSERKLVLQERRADLAAERGQVLDELTEIELRPSDTQDRPAQAGIGGTGRDSPQSAVQRSSAQERASVERQLAELRENLRLIEERKSEYVLATDVPLSLVKEHNRTVAQIKDLEDGLSRLQ